MLDPAGVGGFVFPDGETGADLDPEKTKQNVHWSGYEACGTLSADPIKKLIITAAPCPFIGHAYSNGSCNPCWATYAITELDATDFGKPKGTGVADFWEPAPGPTWVGSNSLPDRYKDDTTLLTATL